MRTVISRRRATKGSRKGDMLKYARKYGHEGNAMIEPRRREDRAGATKA
jgi:hypothetical protein